MLSFLSVAEGIWPDLPSPYRENFSFIVRMFLNPQELTILSLSATKVIMLHFCHVNLFSVITPSISCFKGQLQRFHKLSLFDRFRHVENDVDINF